MRLLGLAGVHILTLATFLALDAVWLDLTPAGRAHGHREVA
jgi:hypothetical protein